MSPPATFFPALFPLNLWWSSLSSLSFCPLAEFPLQVLSLFPPRIVSPPVRRCILSCMTLPRPPQWRYECFSDAINTHSSGKAGPKIFSRKIPEIFPVLTPLPGAAGATSKPDFSSSNFHRDHHPRAAQYFFVACYGSVNQTVKAPQ